MECVRTERDTFPLSPADHQILGHPITLSAVIHVFVVALLAVWPVTRNPIGSDLVVPVEIVLETPTVPRKPLTRSLFVEGSGQWDIVAKPVEVVDDSGPVHDRSRFDRAPHGVPADLGATPRAEAGNAIKDPGSSSEVKQRVEETTPGPAREGRPLKTSAREPPAPLELPRSNTADESAMSPVAAGDAPDDVTAAASPETRHNLSKGPADPKLSVASQPQSMEADRHAVVARGNPVPDYPKRARRRGLEGRVLLRVIVDPEGRPAGLNVLKSSGHRLLDRAALRTVRVWRFFPARRNGQTVTDEILVPIVFRLTD